MCPGYAWHPNIGHSPTLAGGGQYEVQDSTQQYSTPHCITVQTSTVQYSTPHCSTPQSSTVNQTEIQYSSVKYTLVHTLEDTEIRPPHPHTTNYPVERVHSPRLATHYTLHITHDTLHSAPATGVPRYSYPTRRSLHINKHLNFRTRQTN